MQVVINNNFGGFELKDEALDLYSKYSGKKQRRM